MVPPQSFTNVMMNMQMGNRMFQNMMQGPGTGPGVGLETGVVPSMAQTSSNVNQPMPHQATPFTSPVYNNQNQFPLGYQGNQWCGYSYFPGPPPQQFQPDAPYPIQQNNPQGQSQPHVQLPPPPSYVGYGQSSNMQQGGRMDVLNFPAYQQQPCRSPVPDYPTGPLYPTESYPQNQHQ